MLARTGEPRRSAMRLSPPGRRHRAISCRTMTPALLRPARPHEVTVDDLVGWLRVDQPSVVVELRADVRVDPFAQAAAVLAIPMLASRADMRLRFTGSNFRNEGPSQGRTLFWPAMLANCQSVDEDGVDVTGEVRRLLRRAHASSLGAGTGAALVFHEPLSPMPAHFGGTSTFPNLDTFTGVLGRLDMSLGGAGETLYNTALAQFLYETTLNSHEHGRADAGGRAHQLPFGLAVSKYIFASDASSRDQPFFRVPEIAGWLQRIWPELDRRSVTVFTVSDPGPGIHATVPATMGATSWDRLCAAFHPGVSRKPPTHLGYGEGLATAWRGARDDRAFLGVISGAVAGFADFSLPGQRGEGQLARWNLPWLPAESGTTLILVVGGLRESGRQGKLFSAWRAGSQ